MKQLLCYVCTKEEEIPYEFYVNEVEVRGTLCAAIEAAEGVQSERVLEIVYRPQAMFRVRSVSRCSSSMSGEKRLKGLGLRE